jgi:hypothetical protein
MDGGRFSRRYTWKLLLGDAPTLADLFRVDGVTATLVRHIRHNSHPEYALSREVTFFIRGSSSARLTDDGGHFSEGTSAPPS